MLDTDPTTRSPNPTRPSADRSPGPVRTAVAVVVLLAALIAALVKLGEGSEPQVPGVPEAGREAQRELEPVSGLLAWAPPELSDPETVEVSDSEKDLDLDPDRDYVVEMPDEPLDVVGGLRINGGRNVVLIGGEIRISEPGDEARRIRGLYLSNQTGTVHVEGLRIGGDALGDGINLNQRRGATVQLQNIRVDGVRGKEDGHHADLLQTWAGPSVLRVDHFTGHTTYQGFFLLPQQFGDQDEPERFDFRNVNIVGGDDAGYLLWRDGGDWPVSVERVYVTSADDEGRDDVLWDTDDDLPTWDDVQVGEPPTGDFVPEDSAGVGYVSPGYQDPSEEGR